MSTVTRPQDSPLVDSICRLTQQLVQIPSQGGIDSYEQVVGHLEAWLGAHDLPCNRLFAEDGRLVGLLSEIRGTRPGPTFVLDATIDTAPFGDPMTWNHGGPLSGHIEDGWLYGRGASDSKSGVAIFSHVGAWLSGRLERLAGRAILLFEGDEHSGTFDGAKAFFENAMVDGEIDGLMIGYPGNERIVVGSRGFARYQIVLHGKAGHTGGSSQHVANAIVKAAALVRELDILGEQLVGRVEPEFDRPPKVSVTQIEGGVGYSLVPDLCTVGVDFRLTPKFDRHQADQLLQDAVKRVDTGDPDRPTEVKYQGGWPPFHTSEDTAFVKALKTAAERILEREVKLGVVGPSNIGNYVAQLGIPATAGFGATYRNFHAANEAIEIASLEPVYEAYCEALAELLDADHSLD